VLQLAEKDLQELRTYANPPSTVERVLAAVCIILGFPSDWDSALTLMNHATVPFFSRVADFDVATLRAARLAQLRACLGSDDMDPVRVRVVSKAAHSLVMWVHAVEAHAKVDGIRLRERKCVRAVLERSSASQVLLNAHLSGPLQIDRVCN
jgi:dynein heavy chain, axonemal